MGKQIFVICSDCGKTLKGSAICINCENTKTEKDFQNSVQDIIKVIRAARAHIKATIKKSGFGVKELGLDPAVLSLIKPTKKRKKKRRGAVQKSRRSKNRRRGK